MDLYHSVFVYLFLFLFLTRMKMCLCNDQCYKWAGRLSIRGKNFNIVIFLDTLNNLHDGSIH